MTAEQCRGCGAGLTPGVAWCSQCYLPVSGAPVAGAAMPGPPAASGLGERSIMAGTYQQAAAAPPPQMVKTRWKKTPTTFGPVGRVVWSVCLLIPVPPMIIGTAVGIIPCLIGLGIWLFIIMPWALRDLWKAGSIPAG